MKRNKFFSPALMLEGIKQTRVVGICFAIISVLASCGYPLLRLISYASMDYDTLKAQPYFTIDIATFSMPIFLIQYIMPIVMIFLLFNFMNIRKASDFYHSIPLSKTCVYLTYTVTALIWSIVTVVVSTLLSFTIYALSLKTVINIEFIWPTIISSVILAMLVASIALLAKGLSGTIFTNIIITLIIMFLPSKPEADPNRILSERYGSLKIDAITLSTENKKNHAIVLGEGEGEARVRVDVDLSAGEQKRSMFVDARDILREEGETDDSYNARLAARGYEKLLEQKGTWTCAMNPLPQEFGTLYDLGDIITVLLPDYDLRLQSRLTRFTQQSQNNVIDTILEVGTITILR